MQSPSSWQGRTARDTSPPRALVVGCGFIGSSIVKHLVAAGEAPAVLTRSEPAPAIAGLVAPGRLHLGDAADQDVLAAALNGIEHVVFSAGGLLPADSERDPALDERLTLTPVHTVLDALRDRPGVSLVYLSSGGTVYGEPQRVPVREDDPTEPLGTYGELHLRCEAAVLDAAEQHELPARILRCATVYGEGQVPDRGQGVITTFLHRIEHRLPITLYGGGSTIRDYIYVGDVATVVAELLERRDGPSVLNVGSGDGTSLLEVLELAEKQTGLEAEVVHQEERDFEVHQIVLDTARLRQIVTPPATPLTTGVERTHRWLTSHTAGIA